MRLKQALVVIDAQQELIEGNQEEQAVYRKEELLETINKVIKKAIEENVQIIFVRDQDVAGGEGDGFQVHKKSMFQYQLSFLTNSLPMHSTKLGCWSI